ncbi:MAG: RHS repeat-associated core domain-containing protein [Lysobacterales bacterium]
MLARTFTVPPYSYTDANLAAGSYSYTARATDNANPPASTTSSAVTVNVNPASGNQPPVVSLVSPANGSSATAPATFIVAANASDADQGIAKVEFFRNGVLASTHTAPPYSYTESNLAAGSYSYTARATDKAIPAASTSSASATITISPAAPTSLTRSYVYDSAQRLCKRIEPESGATVFAYDAAGNLAWSADGQNLPSTSSCDRASVPVSARIVTGYDARNRPTLTDYPGTTPDISRTYFTDGAPRTIASAGNTWTNAYNKRRLLTSEVLALDGVNYGISHGYNGNGHPASIGYPDGATLNYFPNGLGQPTVVGGYASNIRYYPNGAIQSFVYGNGITHTMTPNARQLPARSRDAGPGGVVLDDSYAFDANGNVQSITDQASAGRTTRTMSYDNRDRLTAASAPGLWGSALFSYDALDNLKSADQGARQYRYVYDANQRLARITDPFGTTQWSFGYNTAGDQTSKNAQATSFDAAHRLSAVAGIASYVYDGFGRRVKEVKADGSQDIGVYSQSGQRLYSKRGAESTRHIYLGNTLLAQTKTVGGIPQPDTYLHTDALGSVIAESTASGSIAKRNDYAPWGEPISGPLDGLGYTGHEMDPDTGLVYAQQRYYDPIVGRFLSIDPVAADANTGGNFNRYWYANNNPYRFTDPDGRFVPLLIVAGGLLALSADANAPGPNDTVKVMSGTEALLEVADKLPASQGLKVGRVLGRVLKNGIQSQRAATRDAKRQAGGIPTSKQTEKQSNGSADDGTKVGRQQTIVVPKAGGGTETKSVQVSRDIRGEHAGQPQIEAGTVKPGGQVDQAGRPRIQNEGKVRVDFDPKL